MPGQSVTTEGLGEAVRGLERAGARAEDLHVPLRASVAYWKESERRRFSTSRGWKPNSRRWAAEKRRRGLDPRTLRATGRAERTLTTANEGAGALVRISAASMTVGIKPGRSQIYYLRHLAKKGYQTVTFDAKAQENVGRAIVTYVRTGRVGGA